MSHVSRVELRHLRYFVAVATHGSFNRAAEMLHLTQPALSRQVKDLEDELGVTLVKRGRNSVRLTEAGELFHDEAREVLARADEAVHRVRGETGRETLRVGYAPSVTAGIMPAALEKFQSISPRVRIELLDLSSQEIIAMTKERRLDLVITPALSVAKGIPEFQWTELRRLAVVLIMPKTHPLAKLKRIPPEKLRGLPLVGLAKRSYPEYLPLARALLKPHGVSPRFVSLVDDGVSTLFTELEARRAAVILTEGSMRIMPRTLVGRPFSPALPSAPVMIGLPSSAPSPLAETLEKIMLDEARRLDGRGAAP